MLGIARDVAATSPLEIAEVVLSETSLPTL
jgi:hypothetical protein